MRGSLQTYLDAFKLRTDCFAGLPWKAILVALYLESTVMSIPRGSVEPNAKFVDG